MNCKETTFHFLTQISEVKELVLSLFHTIIIHRTLPTLDFKGGAVSYNSYIGTRDVDCQNFEITYMCVASDQLIGKVAQPVNAFVDALHSEASNPACNGQARGSVTLEFAVHRKGSWGLGSELSAWERWIVAVDVKPILASDRSTHKQQLECQLREELFSALDQINSPSAYMPSLGSSQPETQHIIDFSMPDISPYRFTISHVIGSTTQTRSGVGVAVRRILKDAHF